MTSDLTKLKVGQQVVLIIGVNGSIEGDYFGTVSAINKEKTRVHVGKQLAVAFEIGSPLVFDSS